MEHTTKKYGKEMLGYCDNKHNYAAEDEIMVTITLSEYRELVENNATRKEAVDKVSQKVAEKDAEIKRLKEKIERMFSAEKDEEEAF